MGYLEEFKTQINSRDYSKFLQLWEEYCTSDTVDPEEFSQLLQAIKSSDFAKPFGKFVETALPLWQTISNPKDRYNILKLLIDLENTNTPLLADTAFNLLKEFHGSHPSFNERIRLIGLRNRENFQGAISNYDLLAHFEKGNFLYHNGGWGTGEIVNVSAVREQITVEFENLSGQKHITFGNAFKTLIPLEKKHFLVRRFGDPDQLEKEAKENPVKIIKLLLKDLGPKNAVEIKDELCALVIPENEWAKWWQGARTKIKKDPLIDVPANLKEPFRLRKAEVSHEERLNNAIHGKTAVAELIQISYNFVRDLPNLRKNADVVSSLKEKFMNLLSDPNLSAEQELQIYIFLETMFGDKLEGKTAESLIRLSKDVESTIQAIDILAFKKRALTLVREHREDWADRFFSLLFIVQQGPLRDYILKELNQGETKKQLVERLRSLINNPATSPEVFIWYFQKIMSKDKADLPFSDKEGQFLCLEAFLILLNAIENKSEYKDLIKKMYSILSGKRYAIVREIIEGTSIEYIKEFLLLVSKCQSLSNHDIKILRSLAEVIHPSISEQKDRRGSDRLDANVIWTTEEGYLRTQDRIRQLGTNEIVENAREIEAARALGDLRENSEYKFALERRSRLQGELKTLSDALNKARIITPDDVHPEEVGIGSIVDVADPQGKKISYTLLGPWDADPDQHILSFQSKFAQAMIGCREGETFDFKNEKYTVISLKSFFK